MDGAGREAKSSRSMLPSLLVVQRGKDRHTARRVGDALWIVRQPAMGGATMSSFGPIGERYLHHVIA
jgi:hypothetical protein